MKIAKTSLLTLAGLSAMLSSAQAGDIFLTGHDIDYHDGQNGYDYTVLSYLRGATPAASYKILVIGDALNSGGRWAYSDGTGNHGSAFADGSNPTSIAGYGTTTFYTAQGFAALSSSDRATLLANTGVLEILSSVNCGGCTLTAAGETALASVSADIATAFNAGMDIWANASAGDADYYTFLPPAALATGVGIADSAGFSTTAAGSAIGITDGVGGMINGFPTHNTFTSFAPALIPMETYKDGTVESLGAQNVKIDTGGGGGIITTPDSGTTVSLFGMALAGVAVLRRKFSR